jgi:hypothetical protein
MNPLDLSKAPPRSPREELDGLKMLPRTIDKLRASLPGGNLNGYRIPGQSQRLLDAIGVKEEDLREVVLRAFDDSDVAAWLRSHADTTQYAIVNDRLSKRTIADVDNPARFNEQYPWVPASGLTNLFDIMEEDDRRSFSSGS